MAEDSNINHGRKPPQQPTPGTIRPRKAAGSAAAGGGEIVEVQGGHIVRSTGRKDRHSKVCTAKGPRDRRVRLSAHTAIQFYDVQDRLGYDRPSKAVDWLINKAKAAIDELAELPPWDPAQMMLAAAAAKPKRNRNQQQLQSQQEQQQEQEQEQAAARSRNRFDFDGGGGEDNRSGFLLPSLDTDPIATETREAVLQSFHHHHHHRQQHNQPDLLAGTGSHTQDLRLSLHPFHDPPPPMILHHHHHESPVLFGAPTNPLGFDSAASDGWENQQPANQRLVGWSGSAGGGDVGGEGTSDSAGSGGSSGGFMFSSPANPYQPIFGQSQLFSSQRGTLQSSNSLSFRAWIDHHHHQQPITTADDLTHHHHHHHQYHIPPPAAIQSAIPGIRFSGEFSGFRIPARFQGEVVEEEHDGGVPNKPPSSASSVSRH